MIAFPLSHSEGQCSYAKYCCGKFGKEILDWKLPNRTEHFKRQILPSRLRIPSNKSKQTGSRFIKHPHADRLLRNARTGDAPVNHHRCYR